MNSGVSIDAAHFQHQVVIAQAGMFTTPQAVCQGIFRDRNNPDRHLWVEQKKVGANEDPAYWRARLTTECDAEIARAKTLAADAEFKYIRLSPEPVDQGLIETRIEFYVRDAVGQNNLRAQVLAILQEAGVRFVQGTRQLPEQRKVVQKEYRAVRTATRAAEAEALLGADRIGKEQADKLERKHRSTQEERREVKRCRIQSLVGDDVPLTEDIVEDYDHHDLRGQVYRFTGVQAFLDGHGPQYADRRMDAYNADPTRAEANDVRTCEAMASVLKQVFDVTSLLDLAGAAKPDDERLAVLRGFRSDPDIGPVLRLPPDACERPLKLFSSLMSNLGLASKGVRQKVDGRARFTKSIVDPVSVARMVSLTAHQRDKLRPSKEAVRVAFSIEEILGKGTVAAAGRSHRCLERSDGQDWKFAEYPAGPADSR